MVYCMSDIHGDYKRFKAMLKLIQFTSNDTLYILGDAIDRGPDGVDILLDIMKRPNMCMILGNHEAMLLATLGPNNEIGARKIWERNGGDRTRVDLLHCRRPETRESIINFLLSLPDQLEIEVNGTHFLLVHGYPGLDRFHRLWNRPNQNETQSPIPGKTVIVGHTPTAFMTDNYDIPSVFWHGPGIIDIDCGCGHTWFNGRLGCLRLDDMAEFYI